MGRKKSGKKHATSSGLLAAGPDKTKTESIVTKNEEAAVGENSGTHTTNNSIDQMLDKAEALIDEFNFELAQKFCERALEIEPDHVRALETSATLLLELGNTESAKHCLGRAVQICPESGFSKYMNLGQLMVGATAVQCYQKGIELMIKEKEAQQAEEVAAACSNDRTVTDQDIASGYCAIAEIYMTDCCFDEEAEQKCKEFIDKALEADVNNVEVLQLKASFLLSLDKKEEAKEEVKKSVSLWLPKLELAESRDVPDDDFNPVEVCPIPYPSRMQCGKILIEVEEYEMATDVLETLLDEDDEVADVWYLLGWAQHLQGEEFYNNSRHYLSKAKEVYVKTKHDDPELLEHITELLIELGPDPTNGAADVNLEDEIASSGEEDMEVK